MAGSSLTWRCQITGAAGMTINVGTDYNFPEGSFGHGAAGWRRLHAEAPWIKGRTLVHAVQDLQVGVVGFRVFGTVGEIKTKMLALKAAFSQIDYSVVTTIDGIGHTWSNCEPAEWVEGSSGEGVISGRHLMGGQQNIIFQVPHAPGVT